MELVMGSSCGDILFAEMQDDEDGEVNLEVSIDKIISFRFCLLGNDIFLLWTQVLGCDISPALLFVQCTTAVFMVSCSSGHSILSKGDSACASFVLFSSAKRLFYEQLVPRNAPTNCHTLPLLTLEFPSAHVL
ncbi:hypothetical protein MTR67_029938 [Solanum verrucosum]|uniref:Uncharacterized protein n=1 Tax=Solanum verrucosum TaxID=315347 RepID=A0AAF0R8D8_SOLVR|nr:hypothetical protein MTR67_029938 [Solanum verrucosum]